jgi:hypothetical protein
MTLIALLLVVEGLSTGLWIARLVPRLSAFDALVVALMVARGLVGAMQLTGGVFLMGRRPAAVPLSQWALIASAALTTLEIGARMAPANVVPGFRWPLVGAYWVYAIGAVLYLRRIGGVQVDKSREVQVERSQEVREVEPGSSGEQGP